MCALVTGVQTCALPICEIEADSILKSTLEIDGRKGRLQTEGQADYSILDGEQMATHVVMQEDRTIMTMDPAKLAAAGVANSKNTEPMGQGAKKMGEREIRGFDTTRSEEHTSEIQSLMRISYAVFCLKKK